MMDLENGGNWNIWLSSGMVGVCEYDRCMLVGFAVAGVVVRDM